MAMLADKQFTSPYAMSVFVALTEKQIPFEVRTLDLAIGANYDPEYARTSLTQRVPTLIDGDFALSKSSAFAEYLNDVYPDPRYSRPTRKGAPAPGRFKPGCEAISCDPPGTSSADHLLPAAGLRAAFFGSTNSIPKALCCRLRIAQALRRKPFRPPVD